MTILNQQNNKALASHSWSSSPHVAKGRLVSLGMFCCDPLWVVSPYFVRAYLSCQLLHKMLICKDKYFAIISYYLGRQCVGKVGLASLKSVSLLWFSPAKNKARHTQLLSDSEMIKKILRNFFFSSNLRKYVKPVNTPPDIDLRSGQYSSWVS